jgi:WD40 repeat protein
MSVDRDFPSIVTLSDGSVLVSGGLSLTCCSFQSTVDIYDPNTGVFSFAGSMTAARYGHTATLLPDGRVLLTGGTNSTDGRISSTEIFDPNTRSFTAAANMLHDRVFHTATLLPSGGVLIYGGLDAVDRFVPTSDLYNPP